MLLGHLAVGDRDARLRHERPHPLGGLVDRLDAVVQEEGLAAARQLAPDRLQHEVVVVVADVGAHGAPALGRRLDDRDVAQPGQRHLQRARDRRRGQRQHVDLEPQLAQQLLLLHAEALLLVHDQQAELVRPHVARQQPVGADQDVDLARAEVGEARAHLGGRAEARHHLDPERVVAEALLEGAEVLLGEHRRRDEEHHLPAVLGRLEGGAQRHLGLAVADVAADQPVHRARLLHVGADGLDRLELVRRLAVGEALLELELPLAVVREGVTGAPLALGVEVDQLARERLGGSPGAQLHPLPLLAAELRERRVAGLGADIAADLVELVARHEHAVAVQELELEVVARHAADGLCLESSEEGDSVVLVHHRRSCAQVRERRDRAGLGATRTLGAAPSQQAVLGQHGELQLRGDEAVAQARVGEGERGVLGRGQPVEEGGLHAREVEPRPLRLAAACPGDEGAVTRAHQLLELGLGVSQRARRAVGRLCAELEGLVLGDAREAERGAGLQRLGERLGLDVEVMGVLVVEARRDVLPEIAERGSELLLGRDRHERVVRQQVEQLAEAVDRQDIGYVRAVRLVAGGGDLGELAVLRPELRSRGDLDRLRLLEGALRERREPGQPLDLDVEQLTANRALLGRGVDVEDVAADRELAAILDLVDALVAARHELVPGLVQIEQPALLDLEALGTQVGVGHLLGERRRARHEHCRLLAQQRIERGDAQADQVRRRGEMGLIAHAARGIEANTARAEEGLQVGGQVARGAIVAGHHEHGPLGLAVDQRGEQVGPHARGHECALTAAAGGFGERPYGGVVLCICEEAPEHALRPPGRAARHLPSILRGPFLAHFGKSHCRLGGICRAHV